MAEIICEEYASSLRDLTCNSKPLISMLTMLAEENIQYSPHVVRLIEQHLQKVKPEVKLPVIYLIDSIVKNVKGQYLSLFTQNLVSTFCSVFEKVDEKTRLQLYKLRQTWVDVFPNKKLYAIDVRVHSMDPAWPINASGSNQSIHVNPKFLKSPKEGEAVPVKANQEIEEAEMRRQLIAKQQELLKLQQQKLELELLQAKARLDEQKRLLQNQENEMDQTVQESTLLETNNKPAITTPQITQISAISKDPRNPKIGRPQAKESKPFRIPNLSSAVTKPISNFVSSKAMDGQIKTELKQNASGVMKQETLSTSSTLTKQTLPSVSSKDARNETVKGSKKKESDLPLKVSSKKKAEREWKKSKNENSDSKKTPELISPIKKSPEFKKDGQKKEKDKKSKRDGSKSRKGEKKNATQNAKSSKKDHDGSKSKDSLRRANFRSRRNYRSNRDRSESPEKSETPPSPKLDGAVDSGVKKLDELRNKDGKHKKNLIGDKKAEIVGVDESKENKVDDVVMTDVDLRHVKGRREVVEDGEEPPNKRRRDEEKDMNNLFGSKDQDYRQISQSEKNQMRNDRNSWAQYKAEHPDEFKKSPFPARPTNRNDFVPFRTYDMDLRMAREFDAEASQPDAGMLNAPPGMRPRGGRANDPRLARRGFARPVRQGNRAFEDTRNLRRHPLYERYQMELESAQPNVDIPNALLLDKQGEIMRQADQQLKSGLLTREQHHELLNQLGKLYELQVTRKKQREEQLRERIMSAQRPFESPARKDFPSEFGANRFPNSNFPETSPGAVQTGITPAESSESAEPPPLQQPEPGTRTKISMLSIFQRETSNSTSADSNNPNKLATPADDGDRFIAIDGRTMKLKYFGSVALILEGTKAQEILFRGTRREIFVDGKIVLLGFEGDEQTFYINSKPHKMKFGTPTHEIYIDDVPYEARFGGPAIKVLLEGDVHEIRMSGPPPDVELKELGLEMKAKVAQMIESKTEAKENDDTVEKKIEELDKTAEEEEKLVEEKKTEPVGSSDLLLDEKMDIEEDEDEKTEEPIRDIEERIDNRVWEEKRNYDAAAEPFGSRDFRDKPREKWRERENKPVRPERTQLREYNIGGRQMEERDDYWNRREEDFNRRPKYFRDRGGRNGSPQRGTGDYGRYREGPRRNFNPMYFSDGPRMRFEPNRGPYENKSRGYDGHPRFEMRPRADIRHPGMRQPLLGQYYGGNKFDYYQGEQNYGKNEPAPAPKSNILANTTPQAALNAAAAIPSLDVNDLFQKLLASGIISSAATTTTTTETIADEPTRTIAAPPSSAFIDECQNSNSMEPMMNEEEFDEKLPVIELTSESLRQRHPAIIGKLCRGIQCSSCGLRFSSLQTEKYAQHLDWHFRQNRRERDSAKKAMSRKWYYDVQDWIQFEEIEDMEERARSIFEEQANNEESADQTDDVQSIPVADDEDDNVCAVCGEQFEQFWVEDKEEWHLRDATRVDGATYHPTCYEDIRNISQNETVVEETEEPKLNVPDSWKSLEEQLEKEKLEPGIKEEIKLEQTIKQEPIDMETTTPTEVIVGISQLTDEPIEPISMKQESQSPPRVSMDSVENSVIETLQQAVAVNNEGKENDEVSEKMQPDKELCIKEEILDKTVESISSHLIENDSVEIDVKLNADKTNVGEILVCPMKTAPVAAPKETKAEEAKPEEDAYPELVSPKLPGFTILSPVKRGTELSGLCSIM